MKKSILVCLFPLLIASCSSNKSPLSESECKTIADKEAEYISGKFAKFPEMQASFLRLAESRAAQCAAGDSFNRADYECIMSASGDSEIDKCLRTAAERS
jgi:hypothetical protein